MASTKKSTAAASQSSNPAAQSAPKSKTNKLLVGAVIAAVVIVAIGIYALFASGLSLGAGTIGTVNGTPVYMSLPAMETLLGPSTNYTTYDLFNLSAPANITIIEAITPNAAGNVTEGWVTFANAQNAIDNASMQFYVMNGYNSSKLADSIASTIAGTFATPPQTAYGSYNGLTYAYQSYINSTANYQVITGSKGNYSVFGLVISNSTFTVNQVTLISASADALPAS